jgi:Putative DNA-binding domain
MPSLRDLQQAFAHAILAAPSDATAFASGGRAHAEQRIGIYRSTIFRNYSKALSATFPVVNKLTGARFFRAAVGAFVRDHPSVSGDLNVYGDAFGDFLAGYAPAVEWPYLADVARLEWAIDEAQRAPDAASAPEAVLAAFAQTVPARLPQLSLRLDPSCRFVTSRYPILRIWNAHQADDARDTRIALDQGGDALLVRRDPRGVSIERLTAAEQAWLAALASGGTLGASIDAARRADAAFDLGPVLHAHIGAGTIVQVIDA